MSGWRHVEQVTQHAGTRVCGNCYVENKVCTTPTPDPASPCRRCGRDLWNIAHPLIPGEPRRDHPHQPTRCTCGHPIEERA